MSTCGHLPGLARPSSSLTERAALGQSLSQERLPCQSCSRSRDSVSDSSGSQPCLFVAVCLQAPLALHMQKHWGLGGSSVFHRLRRDRKPPSQTSCSATAPPA